jgi:chemosensory pili system protein ChpC
MSKAIATPEATTELAILMIPVQGKNLVLPNVSVAEIISRQSTEVGDDVPTWFIGQMQWRSLTVPVISYEAINDEPFVGDENQRHIAVINGTDSEIPFWAVLTEGTPKLLRLTEEQVAASTEVIGGPAEAQRVMVNEEAAIIPDLNFIEDKIATLLAELKLATA